MVAGHTIACVIFYDIFSIRILDLLYAIFGMPFFVALVHRLVYALQFCNSVVKPTLSFLFRY